MAHRQRGGSHYHECTVCHERLDEAAHVEKDIPAVQATCQTAGKTAGKECSVCGAILVAQQETQKADHSLSDWKTDAAKGTHYKECSVCHEHFEEATHAAVSYEAVAGKTGFHQGVCECGFKMEEAACTPAAGWKNETVSGTTYHYQECSACNTKLSRAACSDFTYNSIDGDTTNHQKVCTVCNNTTSEAHVSKQKSDANDHWTACEICDYELTQRTAHTPTYVRVSATSHLKQCSVCETKLAEGEYEAGMAIPHRGDESTTYTYNGDIRPAQIYATGGHEFTCADCGGKAEIGHGQKDWGEWTPDPQNPANCQTACPLCHEIIYSMPHQTSSLTRDTGDGLHHQQVCIRCDSLAGELMEHNGNTHYWVPVPDQVGYHANRCSCGALFNQEACQSSRDTQENASSASWTTHSFTCPYCEQVITNQPHNFVEEPAISTAHDAEGNELYNLATGNLECVGCGFRPWHFESDPQEEAETEYYYASLMPYYNGTWKDEAGYVLTVPSTFNGKPVIRFTGATNLSKSDGTLTDYSRIGLGVYTLILPESITELCRYDEEAGQTYGYSGIPGPGSNVTDSDKEQAYMSKLTTVIIKGNVKVIPYGFFDGALNLKTLVLPASVERFNSLGINVTVFHTSKWTVKNPVDVYFCGTSQQWAAVQNTEYDAQYMKLHYSNEWHWGDAEETTPVLGPSSAPAALPALLPGKEW